MSLPEPAPTQRLASARWFAKLWTAALWAYWMLLFTATHLPIDPDVVVPGNDKTMHFVAYGLLGLLFGGYLSIRQDRSATAAKEQRRLPLIGAFVILAIYGVFDELTQPLVGRTCDIWDWLADCGGIAIGLAFAAFWRIQP